MPAARTAGAASVLCAVAPGIGAVYGVRWPLMAAIARGFRNATRTDRPTPLLFIADRLFAEAHLEPRWFAFGLLERSPHPAAVFFFPALTAFRLFLSASIRSTTLAVGSTWTSSIPSERARHCRDRRI